MTYRARILYALIDFLILAAFALWFVALASCNNPPAAPPLQFHDKPTAAPTVEPSAKKAREGVEKIVPPLGAATQAAPKLTPANVNTERPKIVKWLVEAWDATTEALASAKATETRANQADAASAKLLEQVLDARTKAIQADQARIKAEQEKAESDKRLAEYQKNETRKTLQIGIGLCFVAMLVGGVLCKFDMTWGLCLAGGGAVAMGVGIVALSFNHFVYEHEKEIGVAILIVVPIGIAAALWFAYTKLKGSKDEIVKANYAAMAANAVDMEVAGPIFDAIQSPETKKQIDKLKPKTKNPPPVQHRGINLSPSWNSASNLAMGV